MYPSIQKRLTQEFWNFFYRLSVWQFKYDEKFLHASRFRIRKKIFRQKSLFLIKLFYASLYVGIALLVTTFFAATFPVRLFFIHFEERHWSKRSKFFAGFLCF